MQSYPSSIKSYYATQLEIIHILSVNERLNEPPTPTPSASYHVIFPHIYFARIPTQQFQRLCHFYI